MKKRIACLLLSLVMMLSLLPVTALAAAHDNQVRVIVENNTTYAKADGAPWDGTLVDTWVDIDNDSTMMSCVLDALKEKGYSQTGAESNYITEIKGLAAGDGGQMSGWMGTLNDWFTSEGLGAYTVASGNLKAGDEIRLMYSLNYGEDCGGSWSNNDKTVKNVTFSVGVLNKAFDKTTHDYTLTVPAGTTGVVVTPTASNKNFQVRTSVNGTEYQRTAEVPVQNGTVITVKCGDPSWPSMNNAPYGSADSVAAETYTFIVSRPAPAESISLNKSELTLNKGDFETLTATVTPDDATDKVVWSTSDEAVATVSDGKITAVAAGTATITATAGAKTATCAVTVTDLKTVTVNVAPKAAKVTFYSDASATSQVPDNMVKDNGEKKVGSYTYHQYTIILPEDLKAGAVYSYRGTESTTFLGGETFKPEDYMTAPLHLLRTNVRYNGAALTQEGDYTFSLKNGTADVSCGTPYVSSNIRYIPTLLIAGVAHSGTAVLPEKWADDFYLNPAAGTFSVTPNKNTGSAATANLPIAAYKKISLTAPKDAAVTFYKQEANYVVQAVNPDNTVTDGDTTMYLFKGTAAHSNYQYRAMMNGKVTQAGYLKDGDQLTVSFSDRVPADTSSTLAYDDNNVLLNIDDSKDTNELVMQVGDTFKLRSYRAAWQVVNTTMDNQMIEPDFHYAVLSGNDVISVAATVESAKGTNYCSGNATGNWMNVTALKQGTAVIAVWYDAMDIYGANPTNAAGISTFGATDPANYGYVMVNVGADSTVDITPVSADGDWDAEFDTVYYTGDNGIFTFTSDAAKAVTVTNLYSTTMGAAQSVTKSDDGKWNVPVLNGSNLITITSDAGTDYRLIRAKKVAVTYTDVTTGKSADDISKLEVTKGDTIKIHYDGLNMPIPKMSGIYNPGYMGTAKVAYMLDGKYTVLSAGTQYDFASSEKSDITFKIPSAGKHTLTGYISLSSMGDDFGNHRNTTDMGRTANMSASEKFGSFGSLPEIVFTAEDNSSGGITYEEATSLKSVGIYVGGSNAFYCAAKFTAVKDYQEATWTNNGIDAMSVTVTPNSFYNSITLRYWYEGENAVEMPLTGGVGTVIDTFKRQTGKTLTIEVLVTPGDTSLGGAKVYTFVVMSQADKNAITKVINAIKGIGEVTPDSNEKIAAARAAYDALSDTLKAKVTNYDTLVAAEQAYAAVVRDAADRQYQSVGENLQQSAEKNTPSVGSIGGEWEILGLARSGKLTDDVAEKYFANVSKVVKDNSGVLDKRKYTEYSRVILALTAAGYDPTNVEGYDLTAPITDFDKTIWQGNNGATYALIALDSHDYQSDNTAIRKQYVDELLGKQLDNGGWNITSGTADPDMTAMVIQALAPYYESNADVRAAVDSALNFLSEKQGADGDFGSCETCAQVVVALSALGIDAASDGRFAKNGHSALSALNSYYVEDATYGAGFVHDKKSGSYNQMATEQGYYALTAYHRFMNQQSSLYDMNDVALHKVYVILDGADSVIRAGESVSIRASGALADFVKLQMDGNTLDTKNYALSEGSTIVTFDTDYLKSLEEGVHTVTFVYTDGEVSTSLTVKPAENPNPADPNAPVNPDSPAKDTDAAGEENVKTGDAGVTLWVMLAITAVCGMAYIGKKRHAV